jgi:D-alanyl-D-alanine carboxypeptidase (penicillin-binding protein 5/6)
MMTTQRNAVVFSSGMAGVTASKVVRAGLTAAVMTLCFLASGADVYAFETKAREAYVVDMSTGAVLFDKAGEQKMYPASMTKMMTVYLLFKELKAGKVSLDSTYTVSEKAWRMGGSKMFVDLNTAVRIEDLIRGILIQSGNDACVVVAEGLAGTEDEFARRMTAEAQRLGMTGTNFLNATGWPDDNHYTTAHDLAVLAQALIKDFPEYYHYFSENEFTWHGITQQNRNLLLARGLNVDGLKTGHTDVAGFGMTISATDARNKDRRLVAVVHGLANMKERASESEAVLRYALATFESFTSIKAGQMVVEAPVAKSEAKSVALTVPEDVKITVATASKAKTTFNAEYDSPIVGALPKGTKVGTLTITPEGLPAKTVPLVTSVDIPPASFMTKLIFNARSLLGM